MDHEGFRVDGRMAWQHQHGISCWCGCICTSWQTTKTYIADARLMHDTMSSRSRACSHPIANELGT